MQQSFDEDFDVELEAPITLVAEIGFHAIGHQLQGAGFAAEAFQPGPGR